MCHINPVTNFCMAQMIVNGLAATGIICLIIAAVLLVIVYTTERGGTSKGAQEGFVMTPEGATLTPQGAIVGPVVYTNHMTTLKPEELATQAANGDVKDTSCMVVGARPNASSLDDAYKRQQAIMTIQDKSNQGYQQVDDLKEISKNITYDANSIKGMYVRDGTASSKLYIDKYATVGVIDEQYLPSRGRPKELRAVGTAIIMPGFSFDPTKALHSDGTGICPTGGVPGVGIARHQKRTTALHNYSASAQPAEQTDEQQLLESNSVISATTVSAPAPVEEKVTA